MPHPYLVPLWPATLAAVLIAAFAAALTYALFRTLDVSRRTAVVAGAFVAIGAPLWSVSANALWPHGLTHVLLVGFLLTTRGRMRILPPLLAAAVVTVRPHLAVAVFVLALVARSWPRRAAIVAGGLVGLGLVATYSVTIFGQPLPAAGYSVTDVIELPLSSPCELWAST